MPQAMSRPQNPLTEDQAREARERGEIARIAREAGVDVSPWQVVGPREAESSEEDLRYRDLRSRWETWKREYLVMEDGWLDPLAHHRSIGTYFSRAWRAGWAMFELALSEWAPGIEAPHVDVSDMLRSASNGSLSQTKYYLFMVKPRLPGPLSPNYLGGFDFDFPSLLGAIDRQHQTIMRDETTLWHTFSAQHEDMIAGLRSIYEALGGEVNKLVSRVFAEGPLPAANDAKESVLRKLVLVMAAIEAAIITRKPIPEIMTPAFQRPWEALRMPSAVRWTSVRPRKGQKEVRGYPINARGQFDALAVLREYQRVAPVLTAARVWGNVGLSSYSGTSVLAPGQEHWRRLETRSKALEAKVFVEGWGTSSYEQDMMGEVEGIVRVWGEGASEVSAEVAQAVYAMAPLLTFHMMQGAEGAALADRLMSEGGLGNNTLTMLVSVVWQQKGLTDNARDLCVQLYRDIEAAFADFDAVDALLRDVDARKTSGEW